MSDFKKNSAISVKINHCAESFWVLPFCPSSRIFCKAINVRAV